LFSTGWFQERIRA